MPWLLGRASVRRGLIVALDGLAIWLLAIVLAAYADPGSVDGSSGRLVTTSIETTIRWATTAGVGVFELVAFAGLAVAVVGPTWYAVDRLGEWRGRSDRPRGVLDRGTDGFRYGQPESSIGDGAGEIERGHVPPSRGGSSRATTGEYTGRDRIAELFDSNHPPGDFLRGTSDESTDEPGSVADADDPSAVEGNDQVTVSDNEILVSMDERDDAGDLEITVRADGDPEASDAVTAAVDDGESEETAGGVADDERPDRPSEEPSTAGDPTVEGPDADDEKSVPRTGEQVTSIDELGAALVASQARIERVSDRIVASMNGSDNEALPNRLDSIFGESEARFGELRALDSDELLSISQRVPEIRASQRRFEAAADAFIDGE